MLLPPPLNRTPIYTYYDSHDRATDVIETEEALLLAWRRAWWAAGFKPIILTPAHARKSTLYHQLQSVRLDNNIESEFLRWIAWSHSGGGILCDYLAFPMSDHNDLFLRWLRGNDFMSLTRFKPLADGLYVSNAVPLHSILEAVVDDPNSLTEATSLEDALPLDAFSTSSKGDKAIAYYSHKTLKSTYPSINTELSTSKVTGLKSLQNLITAHLKQTWQSFYPSGIAILKPLPEHSTSLTSYTTTIAQRLSSCPSNNPMPSSCPPNNPFCTLCTTSPGLPLHLAEMYENKSNVFSLGTVPHPLTSISLHSFREPRKLDTSFIRRKSPRDAWLTSLFGATSNTFTGGQQYISHFKSAVAAETTLWLTAERDDPVDLSWIFGFPVGDEDGKDEESPAKVQASLLESAHRRLSDADEIERNKKQLPSDVDLGREKTLIQLASEWRTSKGEKETKVREMVEAWNLGDWEVWRFVKGWNVRREAEMEAYEKEMKGDSGLLDMLS